MTDLNEEVCPTRNAIGEVTSANWGCTGAVEVSNVTYAPRGNVSSFDAATGTVASKYDHEMRRVSKDQVGCSNVEFHYGQGRDMLQIKDTDYPTCSGAIASRTDSIISVAGERIATYHSKSTGSPTNQMQYLLTDRMGVVRKAYTTTGTLVARMVMDPWGRGEVVQHSADALAVPTVLDTRYPGQYQEEEAWIIENGYRVMIPALGQYMSGDPMHSSSLQAADGPQAYGYAAWRPTGAVDADGRRIKLASAEARTVMSWAINMIAENGVQSKLANLINDPGVDVSIYDVGPGFRSPSGMLIDEAFGGITESSGNGQGCGEINIYCSRDVWRTSNTNEFPGISSDQHTFENLLIHELSHAWYRRFQAESGGLGDSVFSSVESILWENSARRARGFMTRGHHP